MTGKAFKECCFAWVLSLSNPSINVWHATRGARGASGGSAVQLWGSRSISTRDRTPISLYLFYLIVKIQK